MKFPTVLAVLLCSTLTAAADTRIDGEIDQAIHSLMAKHSIPGMAVGITVNGKSHVYNYGLASVESQAPITRDTLFELGSISKTFTATLACWAEERGRLSLSDPVGKYLPSLRGTPFGEVQLLHLGTHTPGGLPLQVPDGIRTEEQLLQYFKEWKPAWPAGTRRTYANPGIGTLGLITARSMGEDFTPLVERRLLPALRMRNTFINVPAARMHDYAQGYTKDGTPIRMSAGVLSSEAYGIKSTAGDLIQFVEANMKLVRLEPKLLRAIAKTHTGYFRAGAMTQDLVWEQYSYPVQLKDLLDGNSADVIYNPTPVTAIDPPERPREDVLLNKTGSTNGFAAYVAFVPSRQLGIVLLANKSYPIPDRVTIAHQILTLLARQ
jgi:beta-lactamase class C